MKIGKIAALVMLIVGIVITLVVHTWIFFDPDFNPSGAKALGLFGYALIGFSFFDLILLTILSLSMKRKIQENEADEEYQEIVEEDPEYQEQLQELTEETESNI